MMRPPGESREGNLTAETYLARLMAEARAVTHGGDPASAWRAADRLVRIDGGREAGPLVMRAGAAAALGDIETARSDLAAAFDIDPSDAALAASALRLDGPERQRRIVHLLRARPDHSLALREAAALEGITALVSCHVEQEEIRGEVSWQGETGLDLVIAWENGETRLTLSAPLSGSGPLPRNARFSLAWPADARWVRIEAPGPKALIVPPALNALAPPAPPMTSETPAVPGLMIVVPVYSDPLSLRRCLASIMPALTRPDIRLVIVEDAAPDPEISKVLKDIARVPRVSVLRNAVNLGFAGSANRALMLRNPGEDALLLNSDATLPPDAIARLRRLSRLEPDIGTLTPLSNNGEETSVPTRFLPNPEPGDALLAYLDACAQLANGDTLVPLVNGIGFCLYMSAPLLDRIGGLSGEFERGYFEDVELCLRAQAAGFRNLCASGVYVAHAGSRSFGGEKRAYIRRNLARLNARFPAYESQSRAFFEADPLKQKNEALARHYLAQFDAPRLLALPSDCPSSCAFEVVAPRFKADFILQPAQETGGLRIRSAVEARSGFELDLTIPVPAQGEPSELLRQAMPYLTNGEIMIFDPARLEEALLAALEKSVPSRPARIVPPKQHTRDANFDPAMRVLGLFAPEMSARTAAEIAALAALLDDAGAVTRLLCLDPAPLPRELALAENPRIRFAGGIESADLAAYARKAGIDAFLFVDRHYGGFDPRRKLIARLALGHILQLDSFSRSSPGGTS
ncbi:MAG: glycosyltransferase [Proteobacteria bacterium]|nr:glycosyltransferase [Pseudomonadota bacterium]